MGGPMDIRRLRLWLRFPEQACLPTPAEMRGHRRPLLLKVAESRRRWLQSPLLCQQLTGPNCVEYRVQCNCPMQNNSNASEMLENVATPWGTSSGTSCLALQVA